MTGERRHEPVLEEVVIDHLAPAPGDVMVDLTVGAGGHAARILGRVGSTGRVIGVDRDARALEVARRTLEPYGERVILVQGCSDALRATLRAQKVSEVQGILLDLGVSSMQLDDPERGFSFRHDGPLSMRMGTGPGVRSAMDVLKDSTVEELERIFREYGEEPSARRIAQRLKDLCKRRPPRTTLELANFVESLHPSRPRGRSAAHPATRVFQALRIATNDELGALERTLPQARDALAPGGRLAVIAFHSLEDRIVKRFFRDELKAGAFASVTRKPIVPEAEEIARNPRSRSARLRVATRNGAEDVA